MTSDSSHLDPWPAPFTGSPVHGLVAVPGSKSMTARQLVVSALADSPSRLEGALRSRDTDLMIEALKNMGVQIDGDGDTLDITPAPLKSAHVEVGLAGTVFRFLAAVGVLADGPVSFDGDKAMYARPIEPLLDALDQLGATITAGNGPGGRTLPLTVSGPVSGNEVTVNASGSSQFISAMLLLAPRLPGGLTIKLAGTAVPSLPHISMTVEALRNAGADITENLEGPISWVVSPGPLNPGTVVIEPDLSNASPFLAAAAATGGSVSVPRWPAETTQAGALIVPILEKMGATSKLEDGTLTITGPETLKGVELDMHEAGELTPTVAALAALAETPSRLSGIAHLRGHETDRLAAISTEITKLGGVCVETANGLYIEPKPMHGGVVDSYEDHRMATFGAILGLAVEGVSVLDIGCTSKTMPDFPGMWTNLVT
ncbi:3-phosphoshikimate 1-carboxyvinyltransferase [Flaviflexus sp.]|uniref:3-phosphoshikimate 1-carboxyvinyltransferase n=1 Tax=Flaviflexus sp. TaxID=1969482 RepID=UPI003F932F61